MSTDRSPNCSCTTADDLGLPEDFIDPNAIAYYDPTCPVHRLDSSRMTGTPS